VSYASRHLEEAAAILSQIDAGTIERTVELLAAVRERGGRLFFIGVG
jgi:D-sedoheptulose 7-phosphate isomerase